MYQIEYGTLFFMDMWIKYRKTDARFCILSIFYGDKRI